MIKVAFHPKLYEIRLIQSHVDFYIKNHARKQLTTVKDTAELSKNPLPLVQLFDLVTDQAVLVWQYFNELPLKINFTILSSKCPEANAATYMKYLAASLYLPTYLFRGSPNHVNYDLKPIQHRS